jgi:hypothetical protein
MTYDADLWGTQSSVIGLPGSCRIPRFRHCRGRVARSSDYLWLGIGSWNAAPVVQAGTYVIFPGGRYEERGAWYERYPRDPWGLTGNLAEDVGDYIEASVIMLPGAGHRWRLTVKDVTTGAHWSKPVSIPDP